MGVLTRGAEPRDHRRLGHGNERGAQSDADGASAGMAHGGVRDEELQLHRASTDLMKYDFLVESYASERVKVLSVWSEFRDEDLPVRPNPTDPRGRSVHEQMVHQCMSEDLWFRNMLGIDVQAPPLPEQETRIEFIKRYAEDSGRRLALLQQTDEPWWEQQTKFFDVERS